MYKKNIKKNIKQILSFSLINMSIALLKQRVLDMCRFSALVYYDMEELRVKFQGGEESMLQKCTAPPVLLENTEDYNDGQAYFAMYTNTCDDGSNRLDGILGFRGTENFRDWLSDFNVARVRMNLPQVEPVNEPKVHYGFIRQYRTIDTEINTMVKKMIDEKGMNTLHVTGHSLGGALASISAVALKKEFPELNIHCYTFGSPRPGDLSFAQMFGTCVESSHRFLNNNDPVTATPTTWRFAHVPGGRWIYPDGMDTDNRTSDWNRFWKIAYHGILSFMGRVTTSLSEYHGIQKYYEDIETTWDGR